MTKDREKSIAIELRSEGLSYTEIYARLHEDGMRVSKGSLSNWLREVDLEPGQIEAIRQHEITGREKGLEMARKTIREKRVDESLAEGFLG